jgi:cysteinyl-tRNA synthetase
VHNGNLTINGEKMAKSVGNVLLARDLLAEHGGETIRFALLKTHYRQPLDWTGALVSEARQNLDRLYGALRDAGIRGARVDARADPLPPGVLEALEDDLNTPLAISELLALARAANSSKDATERREIADRGGSAGMVRAQRRRRRPRRRRD